ncbi:hypothetical protein D3C84_123670 [compost metagenome]
MGLFSSKKKISVSSVTYNLAGDEKDRVQYLPSVISTAVIGRNDFSMGEAIQNSMLGGPGMKMRNFGKWARTHGYTTAIGLQSGSLLLGNSIDISTLLTQLPTPVGKTANVQTADIGAADYGFWADQWMLENYPAQVNSDYEIDFNEVTNTIYILFGGVVSYSFNPVGFNPRAEYLYVSYTITDPPSYGPVEPGTETSVGSPAEYPDTTGWTNNGTTTVPQTMDLEETVVTVITYSDGRPDEGGTVVTPSTGSYDDVDTEYEQKTYHGQVPGTLDAISATVEFQHNLSTGVLESDTPPPEVTEEDIGGGVTKTTTVTTTTESVGTAYSYRVDTQEIIEKSWSVMHVLIYEKDTGNAVLDAMFAPSSDSGAFYPFMPVRLYNQFLSDSYYPDTYALNQKAYKKAIGSDYDKLVASVADNASIGDVDHAYVVYGVSLNTKEKASQKYVYKFFQSVMAGGAGGVAEYAAWQIQWSVANNAAQVWNDWKDAQSTPGHPLFGTPEPVKIAYPAVPLKQLNLRSDTFQFNFIMKWNSMEEVLHTGVGQVGAKRGDLWWTQGATITYEERLYGGRNGDGKGTREIISEFVTLNWQDSPTTWRSISIWGLQHVNIVYGGKGVDIYAKEALADTEESGFLIPLHEGILRSMSLKDSTQMTTACTYIVFNCYKVTKQRWYSSSWFKIVLIVAAIVITVVTLGSGAPAGAGLLGTAAAVGAALGFAGTVAIIVGTIANAIAAMLLTRIIQAGATALFGEKVGMIVGTIASVIAVSAGSSYMGGQSLSAGFSNLASAENIMKLTVAAGNGMSEYIGAETKDIVEETQKMLADFAGKEAEVLSAYEKNLGFGRVQFDPMQLTSPTQYQFIPEASDAFLGRTLLTGSEIASMTNDLLSNFTSITLSTELT